MKLSKELYKLIMDKNISGADLKLIDYVPNFIGRNGILSIKNVEHNFIVMEELSKKEAKRLTKLGKELFQRLTELKAIN